ncbi:MAG: hypothetical protein IJ017_00880 [Oscillospiraceae bacterium]|nr:hypothetical protein [Oscillospiraceae bacterium]
MNEKTKKTLTMIGAIIFVVVVGAWIILGGTDHIEDTNGSENFSLQTITNQDIVGMSTGSIGGPTISRSTLTGDTVEFSAEKFTGVYEILYDNFIGKSDFVVDLTAYEIYGGNFELVVVHNDEIVAVLEPGLFVNYRLEDITGYVSLRIAGESASFSFSMTELEYDYHSHAE